MNPTKASKTTQFKVGLFTLLGILLVGGVSVYVNDRPFWWRPCQLVKIQVDDATGLKTKSPVRSLGLEIGFLDSVELSETHVTLGICITAPVQVLPSTRAYIRGEGFLGDKFVELKPVKYIGKGATDQGKATQGSGSEQGARSMLEKGILERLGDWVIPGAYAAESAEAAEPRGTRSGNEREIPVGENTQDIQSLISKVNGLVEQMTGLTKNLREGISPDELRQTMKELNKTLANASKTFSPEGGLNQTAQRTLAKLEDAIEQLRDIMTRINKGEGSVGMLINDPVYAEQIKQALKNLNHLLNKVGDYEFVVNIFVQQLNAYSGTRGGGTIAIWPSHTHYYLFGAASDPRGNTVITDTQTVAGGVPTTTQTIQTTENAIMFTGMLGMVFLSDRLDLSAGFLYGNGDVSAMLNLGPVENKTWFQIRDDLYGLQNNGGMADRLSGIVHPLPYFHSVYVTAAMEDFRKVNGHSDFYYGAGIEFTDEDIKTLLALK